MVIVVSILQTLRLDQLLTKTTDVKAELREISENDLIGQREYHYDNHSNTCVKYLYSCQFSYI